jgi:hypothetical protein
VAAALGLGGGGARHRLGGGARFGRRQRLVSAAALGLGGGGARFRQRRRLGLGGATLLSVVDAEWRPQRSFFLIQAVFFFLRYAAGGMDAEGKIVRPVKKRSQLTPALLHCNGNGM